MSVMPDPTDEDTLREVLDLIRRRSAPQGTAPTAQEEGREDLSPDAIAGAVKKATPDNALDALAPAAAVAGGLAALPLIPGAARAAVGAAGAGAAGLADWYRRSPRAQELLPPFTEGAFLGEKAPVGGGAQQAAESAFVSAPKVLSAAEARMAENVAGRSGVLADQLSELKGLAGETQQGMAEFLSRRGGEIKAEQSARGLVSEAPATALSRRGGARALGGQINQAEENADKAKKAGQRGAAGFGHGVDAAKDVLENLRSYPKLRGMTMPDDPSMEMPKAIELLRARQAGVGNTWAERARSLRTGTPEEQKLFMEYLDLANNEARVNQALAEGKDVPKLPGDADFRDNYVKLMGAKRSLGVEPTDMVWNGTAWVHASEVPGSPAAAGKAYFDKLRPEVQNVQDEILNVAKGTGQLDAGKGVVGAPIDMNVQHGPVLPDDGFAGRVDYIPNILDRRLQDEFNPGMMSDTDAINWYNKGGRAYGSSTGRAGFSGTGGGAFRQTGEHAYEGSKLELAGDPIQRLAFKGAAVERKGMMNQFVDRLKPLAIDDTAPDFVFDPAIHGAYDMGGGNFKVFPRELALALSDAGKHDGGSVLAKGLNVVNNIAKQGLLKWNPSFQSKQILDDMAVGLFNVPLGKQGEFLRGVKNHASILMDEFGKINKGEFSPDIAAYRRSGRMAEIYESLIETTDEIKAFSKKTLGHELHGVGSKLDELGQIRETAIKSSLADIYMGMGATEERAISLASQVVGDYISSSKTGREIGAVLPMMKWYANAVKRLTAAAVEDPVTGKRNPFAMSGEELKRGASTSPWSKILPLAVSAAVWNSAVSGGEDSSFDGLLIPGTKQKIMFPGYGQLMGSVDNQKTMRPTAQGMLNRVSPGLQIPSIMLTGETLGGRRADPFRNVVSDKSSAKETARRGGVGIDNPVVKALTPQFVSDMLKKTDVQANPLYRLGIESGGNLTPRAQKSLETLSALAGISRRATSADTNGISENVLSALKSFSPVSVVDTGKQESIQFSRDKKDILREFLNAGSSEDRRKAMKEWFDGGGTEKEFLQQLEAGQKEKFMFQSASPNVREMERKSKRR